METDRADSTKHPVAKRTATAVIVVAVVVGAVVGYALGAGNGNEVPTPAPPPASLAPPEQLELGTAGKTDLGAEVTVLTWERGLTPAGWPAAPEGEEYSQAVVRFCAGTGDYKEIRIRQVPYLFNLVQADGALADPYVDVRYEGQELASYNVGVVPRGACATGTVVFHEPIGSDIRSIRFTGNGRFEWDVSGIADGSRPAPSPSWAPGVAEGG